MNQYSEQLRQAISEKVNISTLITDEDTFQFRNTNADGIFAYKEIRNSDKHTDNLTDIVKRGGLLSPILVIKCSKTGKYIVVDGHHRLRAYARAWKGKRSKKIPALILPPDTSVNDARLIALFSNSNDKLIMPKAEKLQGVWELLTTNEGIRKIGGVRKIAAFFGVGLVSYGTISLMLKYYKHLIETGSPTDVLWKDRARGGWNDDKNKESELRREARMDNLSKNFSSAMTSVRGMPPDDVATALESALWEYGFALRGSIIHYHSDDDNDENSDF